MPKASKIKTHIIIVKGRVQGIGFRPYIYNQANKLNITGYVKNTKQGVCILSQGKNTTKLIDLLKTKPPHLSKILTLSIRTTYNKPKFHRFAIEKSAQQSTNTDAVQIMPDLAICPDCIKDIEQINNRRYFYPFTNCTKCGPRYSIIKNPPYDRSRTTMSIFKMCQNCQKEYDHPSDRRFHAQPNACPVCGPQLKLTDSSGKNIKAKNNQAVIQITRKLLKNGKIVAIRSIGGFQIACDAKNSSAIKKLRLRKKRPFKPLAIMCKDMQTAKLLCKITKNEEKLLKSQISPIILLKKRRNTVISSKIAHNNSCLGIMLPYTPLHNLLFANVSRETLPNVLVMTSANPAGSPIISESKQLQLKLNKVVDYILDHNRPIQSRCDDSIVFDYKGPIIVRYSRGFVPEPLLLNHINLRPILAFGADLKNCFALGCGNKIYLSPYIGDLGSKESIAFLLEMLGKYEKWFNIKPEIVACDLHPDYVSARLAEQYAIKHRIKLIKVQHHFAHLAGVVAEHGLTDSVIGLGFDGTGYGTDKALWGSEIMKLDLRCFERLAHLKYLPLVGGDVATTNPQLIAKTYLNKTHDSQLITHNTIMTSSLARLFDAVASILGVCQKQTFEGEAPIALEAEATNAYSKKIQNSKFKIQNYGTINPLDILQKIVEMKKQGLAIHEIAMYFHQWIIVQFVSRVMYYANKYKIKQVCGSGGVFQNRIILQGINRRLCRAGYKFYINRRVPINDGGICLGQAVVAGQK